MNKKDLSERDICSKFIGPALKRAGWDGMMQIREEVAFTKGRIIVRGKLVTRGKAKRADYILYYKPNIPIAIVEAKDNSHSVGDGMQQALDYATTLNIPFVFSSNGDGFVFHDRTGASAEKEAMLASASSCSAINGIRRATSFCPTACGKNSTCASNAVRTRFLSVRPGLWHMRCRQR
jgi:type I restriction enzyme R subunit